MSLFSEVLFGKSHTDEQGRKGYPVPAAHILRHSSFPRSFLWKDLLVLHASMGLPRVSSSESCLYREIQKRDEEHPPCFGGCLLVAVHLCNARGCFRSASTREVIYVGAPLSSVFVGMYMLHTPLHSLPGRYDCVKTGHHGPISRRPCIVLCTPPFGEPQSLHYLKSS